MGQSQPVWDLPLRLFKWGFVLSIIGSVASGKADNMMLHERFALTACGLLLFRLIWGCVGSETARFSHFVKSPLAVFPDIMDIVRRRKKTHFGHSALGGYATLALLMVPLAIIATGLFSTDDVLFDGPLAHFQPDWIKQATRLHHQLHPVLFGLIALHLIAILTYWFRLRLNLTSAMITGSSRHASAAITLLSRRKQIFGIALLVCCVALAHVLPELRPSYF